MRIGTTPLRIVIVGGVSPKTALEQLRWLQLHRARHLAVSKQTACNRAFRRMRIGSTR